jgi:hypothetical protein
VTPDFAFAANLAHLVGRLAWDAGNHAFAEKALRAAFDGEPATVAFSRTASPPRGAPPRRRTSSHRPGDEMLLELRDRLVAGDH